MCVREFKFKSAVTLPCVRVTQLTIDNRYYNHTRPVLARTVLHVGLISGIADEPASAGIAVAVAPRPTMAASLVVIVCSNLTTECGVNMAPSGHPLVSSMLLSVGQLPPWHFPPRP